MFTGWSCGMRAEMRFYKHLIIAVTLFLSNATRYSRADADPKVIAHDGKFVVCNYRVGSNLL